MWSVEESSNTEIEKSCGAETHEKEAHPSVISPSAKCAKGEFLAKNGGLPTDTAATDSRQSEQGIEKPSESGSGDSDESELDQKVMWLTLLFQVDESTEFIHD